MVHKIDVFIQTDSVGNLSAAQELALLPEVERVFALSTGVGEEDDGRHVLHGQLSRPESHVEAVRRGGGGYDHEWALAVTSVEGLHEVRLLALCRHTRRGTAALYIDDDERKLCDNGQADGFTLQRQTRSGR